MFFALYISCMAPEGAPTSALSTTFANLGSDDYRVDQIEPARYLGLWYEYASIPAGFQARCTATTAEDSLIDEETIGVHNRCHIDDLDGQLSEIEGTAIPVDDRFSHLEVQFFSNLSADYYVIAADGKEGDEPYEWAVVSTYNDLVLWVLSREPTMSQQRYATILAHLSERELPIDELVPTLHFESSN